MHFATASLLAFASSVSGHAMMYGAWINGIDQGDGRNDLASPDLVCNVNGGKVAPSFVRAAAGDKITFEWYHNTRDDDIIDLSHKGPIITYIAPYTEDNGAEPIWSKIAEDGYSNGKWAVQTLVENRGKWDFTLPAAVAPGKYLIRQELLAHHESDTAYNVNPARGAQFYPSCVQVEVTSGGSAVPDENFDFNTGYTYADPSIVFNLYAGFTGYAIPGPAVWNPSSSGGSGPAPTNSATPSSSSARATTATPAPTTLLTSVTTPPAAPATSTQASAAPTRCPGLKRKRNMKKRDVQRI
ncbi:cellulase [Madurella fahalii]|uniref:lytic cellulose monooxygenase (C4-dehydrogenating) n=1 Tax=Madurella fahalii TaxID=1157608 RepID=A0ABQ0G3R6_9PEZI